MTSTSALAAGLAILAVTAGLPAVVAADHADAPADAETRVEVVLGSGTGDEPSVVARVHWTTSYPARSTAEAERAANGTLETGWFHGDEHVAAVAAAFPGSSLSENRVETRRQPGEEGATDRVLVSTEAEWDDLFANGRQRIVLGPEFADRLSDGDRLVVTVPRGWEHANASVDPELVSVRRHGYVWAVGSDPRPRVAFERDGVGAFDDPLPLAPLVPVLALLAGAALLARDGRSRS